jgi:hypothetical protein
MIRILVGVLDSRFGGAQFAPEFDYYCFIPVLPVLFRFSVHFSENEGNAQVVFLLQVVVPLESFQMIACSYNYFACVLL